jgi:hypothetical protein
MRKLLFGLVLAVSLGAASSARAGFIVEGSLGKGASVSPEVEAQPLNVMLAPGVTIFSLLRLQVGLVANMPDVENSKFDIGVRPMITLSPPLFPLYGRAIFAWDNLIHDSEIAYGGALGFSIELAGIGVFAEAGFLPRKISDKTWWIIEGRAGVSLGF